MSRPLVLCSTAVHRRTLLARLRLPFEFASPDFDESGAEHLPPADLARVYALGKARSLAARYAGRRALLLGADQVACLAGRVLRKVASAEAACEQLVELAGRTHVLHAAVALVDADTGRSETALTTVTLTMRPLTRAQIERYVAADRPLGSAGGYTFEGLGVSLFAAITGGDDSAIVGLPLLAVCDLLLRFGVDPLGPP